MSVGEPCDHTKTRDQTIVPWYMFYLCDIKGIMISRNPVSYRSRHALRHVRHARVVMHAGIDNPRWRGKRSRRSRRMRDRQFCVYGSRPIEAKKKNFEQDSYIHFPVLGIWYSWCGRFRSNRASQALQFVYILFTSGINIAKWFLWRRNYERIIDWKQRSSAFSKRLINMAYFTQIF